MHATGKLVTRRGWGDKRRSKLSFILLSKFKSRFTKTHFVNDFYATTFHNSFKIEMFDSNNYIFRYIHKLNRFIIDAIFLSKTIISANES